MKIPAGSCDKDTAGEGAVVAWGENRQNDLAAGYEDAQEMNPVSVLQHAANPKVDRLTGVKQVSAGASESIALREDCSISVWGGDTKGQLGNGTIKPSEEQEGGSLEPVRVEQLTKPGEGGKPIEAEVRTEKDAPKEKVTAEAKPLEEIKEVVAGDANVIALTNDGRVFTWGASEDGQGGNGEYNPEFEYEDGLLPRDLAREVPIEKEEQNGEKAKLKVKQVMAGGHREYALTEQNNETEVYVWGEDQKGEAPTTGQPGKIGELGVVPSQTCKEFQTPETEAGEETVTVPGEEEEHPHEVPCVTKPTPLTSLTGHVISLGAGQEAAYAVIATGALNLETKVVAWGANHAGQLGDGKSGKERTGEFQPEPVEVKGIPKGSKDGKPVGLEKRIVEVRGGFTHALARAADGSAYSWGDDSLGELGHKPDSECQSPKGPCSVEAEQVNEKVETAGETPLLGVQEIAAGARFTQIIAKGGVYAMGKNFEQTTVKRQRAEKERIEEEEATCLEEPGKTAEECMIEKEIVRHPLGALGLGYLGLQIGESGFVNTPTKVELEGNEPAVGVAVSMNHTVALLKKDIIGPPPRMIVTPGIESLTVTWDTIPAGNMKFAVLMPELKAEGVKQRNRYLECPSEPVNLECTETFTEHGLKVPMPREVVVFSCEFDPMPQEKGNCGGLNERRFMFATPKPKEG